MDMPDLTRIIALKDVWGSQTDHIDVHVQRYAMLYGLPVIENSFELPSEHLDRENDQFFTVLAIRRADDAVYLVSPPGDPYPRLPGRTLQEYEAPEDVAADLIRIHIGLHPGGMTPIAIVKNVFYSRRGSKTRTHVGVAFDARVAGIPNTQHPNGYFTRQPPGELFLGNRKVLDIALQRPLREVPVGEATEHHTSTWRGRLHSYVVRPLTSPWSSHIIRRELLSMLHSTLRATDTMVDVACGDDTLLLHLGRALGCNLLVGNDICWSSTRRLRDYARDNGLDVLLSNHDIGELPFNARFDVGLVKNVLHHIPGVPEATAFLGRLREIARTLAIVEFEDPKNSRLGRNWNRYYEKWLGDGDVHLHHFLTESKLRRVVDTLPAARAKFRRVWTIKGACLLAVVEFAS